MRSIFAGAARILTLVVLLVWVFPGESLAQSEFSDSKLEAFVSAAVAVTELSEQWKLRISEADDKDKADELRDQANQELLAAVEGTEGITVEEYKQISQAARDDPALTAKIREVFDQQKGN